MIRLEEIGFGVTLIVASAQTLDAEDVGGAAFATLLSLATPTSWPPEYNDADSRAWMRRMLADPAAETGYGSWYVVADGRPVGIAGYKGPPDTSGEVEVGYSIVIEARRKGYASGAVRLLVERAFRDARVASVVAETTPELPGSQRVLESTGFQLISRMPDAEHGEILRYRRSR